MEVIEIKRSFKYNGIVLADPNPALGPDQVREFYGSQYPELNNAVVEGPVTKNGTATFTFARAAGAKGAAAKVCAGARGGTRNSAGKTAAQLLTSLMDEPAPDAAQAAMELARANGGTTAAAESLQRVVIARPGGVPLALPGSAYGIWG